MNKIKIGILCPSEIAFRRFMPALRKCDDFEYIGTASASMEEWFGNASGDCSVIENEQKKVQNFVDNYEGKAFKSYCEMLDSDIDAVYIPLPPALHYRWAKKALEKGKHVFLEKPFTDSLDKTESLIRIAKENNLAVHENYMFQYHSQLDFIKEQIASKNIGDVRLYRIAFGFPFRGANDFRYIKALGGGALLDCGGYTLKLATMLLGDTAQIKTAQLNTKGGFEVDIYGSATMANDSKTVAQLSFGMDNSYKCELEVWGSNGVIYTNRVLTAPDGYTPIVTVKNGNDEEQFTLNSDDSFYKSIQQFKACVFCENTREANYKAIRKQSELVDEFMKYV